MYPFVTLVLLAIPVFYLVYHQIYSVGVTTDSIHAVLQTNATQALEFMSNLGIWKYVVCLVILLSAITFIAYKIFSRNPNTIKGKLVFLSNILIPIISLLVAVNNHPRLPMNVITAVTQYHHELSIFKQEAAKRVINSKNIVSDKEETGEIYLIVMGESINKQHMSIFGYPRVTTPKLQQHKDLILFDNHYSIHTLTRHSLPYALSQANQYNGLKPHQAHTIMDVLHKAKFKTFWLTNHSLYSLWANAVTVIAKQSGSLRGFNYHVGTTLKSQHFDEVLIPYVSQILDKYVADENVVVFVHLYGSHRDSCNRFPPQYEQWQGTLPVAVFGQVAKGNLHKQMNCYDNSILYHDTVVANILTLLKKINAVSGFIYFPDHGFDVVSGRGQNIDLFSFDMTTTPLFAWFSGAYRSRYPNIYQTFKDNRRRLFSNDLIYDTLVGLFNIKTNLYDSRFNLASDAYRFSEEEALVVDGKIKYNAWNNIKYHQKENIKNVVKMGGGGGELFLLWTPFINLPQRGTKAIVLLPS